jgi:hypothetical protein
VRRVGAAARRALTAAALFLCRAGVVTTSAVIVIGPAVRAAKPTLQRSAERAVVQAFAVHAELVARARAVARSAMRRIAAGVDAAAGAVVRVRQAAPRGVALAVLAGETAFAGSRTRSAVGDVRLQVHANARAFQLVCAARGGFR